MRDAFAREIEAQAAKDERIVLLSGDIGNRMYDSFKDRFPDRFLNCGVAEANMAGVAGGLALSGFRPFTYTITTFNTQRCLEQIRLDICYHNVPVTIVGVGGGLSYASLGPTHHACEDIGMLRLLPGMTIICPADPVEVRLAVGAVLAQDGPAYIRLGKKGEPTVHGRDPVFEIGKGIVLREGSDVCLLGVGTLVATVMDAADILSSKNISTEVNSFHCVKPLDTALLEKAFDNFDLVVTVEEHNLIGGAGAAVAEWLVDRRSGSGRLLRIGTPDAFLHQSGNQSYARERFGLTPETIAKRVLAALASGKTEAAQ